MNITTAVIPVGGKGSRMAQCQKLGIQKCLLPIKGNPILFYVIESLRKHGINKLYLLTNHLSVQVEDFVKNNYKGIFTQLAVEIVQVNSRGTADALLNLRGKINEPFLYSNGDIAFPPELIGRLIKDHHGNSLATMAFSSILLASTHAYCEIDRSNGTHKLMNFEFPTREIPHSFPLCSMETMILNPDIFHYLNSAEGEMLVKAIDYGRRDGKLVNILVFDGEWLHLEKDEDIAYAESREFLKMYGVED